MRKSRLGALAAFAATALILSGCAGDGASESEVTSIDYWYWIDDTTDTTIEDLAADFEAETGITVNLQQIPNPQFYDKLVTATAGGKGPDATHLFTPWFGKLIENGVLAPLDEYVADWEGESDVIPSMWNYVQNADQSVTYALPNKQLMFYMYYRKDLFEAAGVEAPTTQEEFVEVAEALYDPANNHYAFDIRGGDNGQDQWAAFLVAGGARFVDESGEVAFDSVEAKESNAKYVEMFEWAPPGSIGNGVGQIKDNFASGTAAMIINHLGASKELVSKVGEENVGVAPIPSTTNPEDTTYLGSMNMNAVLASSEKQEAAFQWISYLTEEKAQLAITLSTNGYLPVVESVASDSQFAENPFMQVSFDMQKSSIAWPALPGVTVATQQVWRPIMQKAFLGEVDSDEVVIDMAEALAAK